MEGAEAAYLDSPKSVVARMNYALWCQTVGRSLERARPLYLGLVDHMARRGPDHPLILYGFCLLLAATMGESMEVIEALAQRARRADIAKGGESFADAERGFFAEALRRRPELVRMDVAGCSTALGRRSFAGILGGTQDL